MDKKKNTKWLSTLLLGWMLIMPLSFSSGLSFLIIDNVHQIEELQFIEWVAVYVIISLTMTFALTPTTVIALLSGYFLGIYAIIPVVISYSLASVGGFYLSKPLGRNFQEVVNSSYPKLDLFIHKMRDKSPVSFVIFSRISPVLPFAVMNIVLPFMGIRFKSFFWGGMLGMLPRTILAIITGKLTKDIFAIVENPSSGIYMQIGFGVLLVISVMGFINIYKKNT